MGLFQILRQNGVEVDDREINVASQSLTLLPLTRFDDEYEAEKAANAAEQALSESGLASANLYPVVSTIFGELALNAVQHAESPVGAYGFVQFYESDGARRFVCGVADGGIGIKRSLENNPDLRHRLPYDWAAIELAVRERISGTRDKTRGIGLFGIAEDMRSVNRQLIIHSGIGSLQLSEDMESEARRSRLFPGTLAYASIPGLGFQSMATINILQLLGKRMLVARGSARSIETDLASSLTEGQGELTLSLSGITGLAPSFFDEILKILEEAADAADGRKLLVRIESSPSHISAPFAAIGRAHGLSMEETDTGDWVIARGDEADMREC